MLRLLLLLLLLLLLRLLLYNYCTDLKQRNKHTEGARTAVTTTPCPGT